MRSILLIGAVLFSFKVQAQPKHSSNIRVGFSQSSKLDTALRSELLRRFAVDQGVRKKIGSDRSWATLSEMSQVDSSNTRFIVEMVEHNGWPTTALVGKDGLEAAFFLVQHSNDYLFQERVLPSLEVQGNAGDISKQEVGMLTDRILVHHNLPQLYGTQYHQVADVFIPYEILNEDAVDERRARMSMPPIGFYGALVNYIYAPTVISVSRLAIQSVLTIGVYLQRALWPF